MPDTACVWAEWYRHLAGRAIPPQFALRRELWTYRLADIEVADLQTPEQLSRVGLTAPQPGRDDWPAFQTIGEQLYAEGHAGLVAPSAARPQSAVLCVFLAGPGLAARVVAQPPPERIGQPPAPHRDAPLMDARSRITSSSRNLGSCTVAKAGVIGGLLLLIANRVEAEALGSRA